MEENQQIITENEFNFQDTEATRKIFELKKRIRAVCGGTSASKTISILVWLIDYSQSNSNKRVDIMSESYPHLEDGAIKDFKAIMMDRNYWDDRRWNESKHSYFFEKGTLLKFKSIDKLGKARGPRRDVLFLNEAPNIPYHIYDQLEVRTKEVIWMDWNPTHEFWYYTEIDGKVDHDFLRLTYLDCLKVLPKEIIESIESKKDREQWWRVYGLGLLGELEGQIYKDWEIIDEVPHRARLERFGLDFGYSNDPTSIVAIYYYDGGYILDEVVHLKGLSNKRIADIIINTEKNPLVIADSAEPKSIDEIKDYGVNIAGVAKTKGENKSDNFVKWSIDLVQQQRISVTKRSLNIIKSQRNYLWQVDKDGKILNVPEHEFSDAMDAVRYGMVSLLKKPQLVTQAPSAPVLPYYGDQDSPF